MSARLFPAIVVSITSHPSAESRLLRRDKTEGVDTPRRVKIRGDRGRCALAARPQKSWTETGDSRVASGEFCKYFWRRTQFRMPRAISSPHARLRDYPRMWCRSRARARVCAGVVVVRGELREFPPGSARPGKFPVRIGGDYVIPRFAPQGAAGMGRFPLSRDKFCGSRGHLAIYTFPERLAGAMSARIMRVRVRAHYAHPGETACEPFALRRRDFAAGAARLGNFPVPLGERQSAAAPSLRLSSSRTAARLRSRSAWRLRLPSR